MQSKKGVNLLLSEKVCWAYLDSPFIVNLFSTDQDQKYFYFFMEPVIGGHLVDLLLDYRGFDESMTMFYAACIILMLEHIHSRGIIYRDLKPEVASSS